MGVLRIMDFDGTLTDPIAEGKHFSERCIDSLSRTTGLAKDEVLNIANEVEADMAKHPERYDWELDGYIVSSLVGDPYLRIIATVRAVVSATRSPLGTRDLAYELLNSEYPEESVLRPDIAALFARPGTTLHVVTNNKADRVTHRLRGFLKGGRRVDVHGSAKKHLIDPEFDKVARSAILPGRERPALLRRREYFNVLDTLRKQHNVSWGDVEVIGDNAELDLALPQALGARTILVANERTPSWELAFVRGYRRGSVVRTLTEAAHVLAHQS